MDKRSISSKPVAKSGNSKPQINNIQNDSRNPENLNQLADVYQYGPSVAIQNLSQEDLVVSQNSQELIDDIKAQILNQKDKQANISLTSPANQVYNQYSIEKIEILMENKKKVNDRLQNSDLTNSLEISMEGKQLEEFNINFKLKFGKDEKRLFLFNDKQISLILQSLRCMLNNRQVQRIKDDYMKKSFVLDFIEDPQTKYIIDKFLCSQNNGFILTIPYIKTELSKKEYLKKLNLGDCVRRIHFSKVITDDKDNEQIKDAQKQVQSQNKQGNLINVHLYFNYIDDFKNIAQEIFQRGLNISIFPKTELILKNLQEIYQKKIRNEPPTSFMKQFKQFSEDISDKSDKEELTESVNSDTYKPEELDQEIPKEIHQKNSVQSNQSLQAASNRSQLNEMLQEECERFQELEDVLQQLKKKNSQIRVKLSKKKRSIKDVLLITQSLMSKLAKEIENKDDQSSSKLIEKTNKLFPKTYLKSFIQKMRKEKQIQ